MHRYQLSGQGGSTARLMMSRPGKRGRHRSTLPEWICLPAWFPRPFWLLNTLPSSHRRFRPLGKPESPLRSGEEKNMLKSRTWIWSVSVWLFAALAIPVQARVVYTPVNVNLPTNGFYPIDLNHDGITDFTFHIESSFCPYGPHIHYLWVEPNGAGIAGSYDASALQSGVPIDFRQSFYRSSALMYRRPLGPGCGTIQGQWYQVYRRYLGH